MFTNISLKYFLTLELKKKNVTTSQGWIFKNLRLNFIKFFFKDILDFLKEIAPRTW